MQEIKTAKQLHTEATDILNQTQYWNILLNNGKIYTTGSYELNLMVYRDLDLYFAPNKDLDALEIYSSLAKELIVREDITKFKIEKEFHLANNILPKGIYCGLRINNLHHSWKIDIWTLEKKYLQEKISETKMFKKLLNDNTRRIILNTKTMLMNKNGKTPSMSSYYIYQAVLQHNITDKNEIKKYINTKLKSI